MDINMDTVNVGALAFSVIAAVAGVIVARWEWLDRPKQRWVFDVGRSKLKEQKVPPNVTKFEKIDYETEAFNMSVTVRFVGDRAARHVRVYPVGVHRIEAPNGDKSLRRSLITQGNDPLEVKFVVPPLNHQKEDPYLEVRWITLRPLREHGHRIGLRRNHEYENWRWHWRSLRPRRRDGEGWWKFRLVRTQGQWVKERGHPLATIPWPREPFTYY
ncbi:hypothetical protein Q8791_22940 [Nocardiopsis sp. CT-R113]|uniref:Uncharacterized protein n=1 Tax=Nocardiopsis codii TaxID=3065942 RepID=A0ABU7KEQ6_9ACTN|nr:hypothetical protein [Nocardiopsis sp. CT-R113]MEE2040077.1 hypothetical protein [Nocardiopsis sp. CT-R113]